MAQEATVTAIGGEPVEQVVVPTGPLPPMDLRRRVGLTFGVDGQEKARPELDYGSEQPTSIRQQEGKVEMRYYQ